MTAPRELDAAKRPVLAFDIGGTKIAAALIADGAIEERRQVATPTSGQPEDWLAAMVGLAQDWQGRFEAVGAAVTGIVQGGQWRALNPAILPVPAGYPLAERLQAAFGRPVRLVNDAQAAAWAEFDARSDIRSLLFVTVSTGIGGGLVTDGKLVEGAHGAAGSMGHVLVKPIGGRRCGCGAIGCIETEASGAALKARAAETFGDGIEVPELFERAKTDAKAAAIIDDALNLLGQALLSARRLCDPELIVIGGGIGLRQDVLARLQAICGRLAPDFPVRIEAARLGADAGLVGSALLAAAR
ncbi:MAG: ROK family protein [Pseudomonadota bacterium]